MDDPWTVSKRTHGQKVVLTYLQQLQDPISAQELFKQLRREGVGLGLATVYRSLEALKREGVIHSKISAAGEALHSLVQPGRGYLTCVHCGESTLIAVDDQVRAIPNLPTKNLYDFQVLFHTWESFGICSQCRGQCRSKT